MKNLTIIAPFRSGENIPDKYTCKGANVWPSVTIKEIPPDAKYIAIIVDDPDAPGGTFTHFTAWNILITGSSIVLEEGWGNNQQSPGAVFGITDFGSTGYKGPCPPPGNPHRYYFKVYATAEKIDVPSKGKAELELVLGRVAVAKGSVMGLFKR